MQSENNNNNGRRAVFKVEELLCKQDVEKLKLLTVTLGIDGEQIKTLKIFSQLNSLLSWAFAPEDKKIKITGIINGPVTFK